MNSPIIFAIIAIIAAGPAAAEVYKCQVDGRTVYKDQPCHEGAAQQILVIPQATLSESAEAAPSPSPAESAPPAPHQEEVKERPQQAEEQYSDYDLKHLAGNHKVVETMTSDLVRKAWGDPDVVHRQMNSGGVTEIWEYHPGGFEHRYVYLQNGRVINVDIQR